MPSKAFVYIVECADGTFYTGWTTNLAKRLAAHDNGKGARYTRGRSPVKLVYWEPQPDRILAQKREYELKQLDRQRKEQIIGGFSGAE